ETLEAEVERHRGGLAGERDRLEALRLEQVRVAGERVDLMRQAGELRERQAQLGRRAERLAQELAEAQAEAERLTGQRATLESARWPTCWRSSPGSSGRWRPCWASACSGSWSSASSTRGPRSPGCASAAMAPPPSCRSSSCPRRTETATRTAPTCAGW